MKNRFIKTDLIPIIVFVLSNIVTLAQTVGPTVPSSFTNTGNWNDFSNFDRSFTVISSITLKSVKVVPVSHWSLCSGATSSLTIDLYKDGIRIDDVTATVNCGAVNPINLNFELLSGFYELRVRNVDNGQMALSNDASEKSITNVILINEHPDGYSGAFFDWIVEGKTGPVIPLPDTVRLCPGQTYDLNFGAYNGERWTSDEAFTTIDDANIRLEPTQSTVYYFEKPTLIPAGENIVQNGDFEAGNTGFTTEYTLNTSLTTRGDYMVGNNASIPLSVGADYNPGTTSGNMLVTKSTPSGSGVKNAWCQTVDVFPNTTYQAEFRVKSGAFTNNPFVTASFNGGNWNFENTGSTWALYNQTWNSGANTTLEYCIQNHLAQTDGNIMLIDDVKLLSADPILAYTAVDQVVVIVESSSAIDLGADENNCDLATTPVTLDAGTGWDSYTWSPNGENSQTISVTAPGTYSVSASKAGGCSGSGTVTYTATGCTPPCTPPSYTLTTPSSTICQGQNLDFEVDITAGTGPFTIYYSLDGTAQTPMTGLSLGTHTINLSTQTTLSIDSVRDASCTNTTAQTSGITTVHPLPTVDLGTTTTICDDGSTPLTLDAGNAGATYAWTPNGETSQTILVNAGSTYSVDVTDGNNCTGTGSVVITGISCTSSCGSYVDYNNWVQQGLSTAGTWTISGDGKSVTQSENDQPTFYVKNEDVINVRFEGDIEVNTDFDNDWIGMVMGYQSPGLVGTYPYDVKTVVLAWKQSTDNSLLEGFSLFEVDATITSDMDNRDAFQTLTGATTLATNYGVGLGWQDFTQHHLAVNYTANNIKVYVDNNLIFDVDGAFEPGKVGFYGTSQPDVTYSNFIYEYIANIDVVDDSLCLGESLSASIDITNTITYPGGTQFNWDFGDGNSSTGRDVTHTYTSSGDYTVQLIVSDGAGCGDTTTRVIRVFDLPTVNLGTTTTICDDGSAPLTLDAGNAGADFSWTPNGETTQTAVANAAGTYEVIVTDGNNCTNTANITITETVCSSCISGDNDSDGVCDDVDLDDDNDGILDVNECGGSLAGYPFNVSNGVTETYTFPAADQGFKFDIFRCDNSFNMEINGVKLVPGELQFCGPPWCNNPTDSYVTFASDGAGIKSYQLAADSASPTFRLIINSSGSVSLFAKRCDNCELEPVQIDPSDPQFNTITWNSTTTNTVVITQSVNGSTYMSGSGYGISTCSDDTDNDGIVNSLDLDSDGDGCPDAIEGGGSFTTTDLSINSLSGGVDANGVPVVAGSNGQALGSATDLSIQSPNCPVVCVNDNDNDGVCDDVDLDDDNDGILDELECNTGGTNDFQWSSPPNISGNTATGTMNGITYTYTSTTPVQTTANIFSHSKFPASYNIPNTTSIKNTAANTNTLTFDSPVLNPVLIFSSIGNSGGLSVPIDFNNPVEVLWSTAVVQNSPTRITGTEGYAIVRMNGTFSSISFDYQTAENYANFMFGGDFVPSCGTCDIDNDALGACFDNDSDEDGCWDALEGDGGVLSSQVDANGMITGGVDANGIPLLIGASGQGLGSTLDATTQDLECTACTGADYAILTPDTSFCSGESGNIRIALTGTAPFNLYYTSSVDGTQSVLGINTNEYLIPVSVAQTIQIDSVSNVDCVDDVPTSVIVTINTLPVVDLGEDLTICVGPALTLDAGNTGSTYLWNDNSIGQTLNVSATGEYYVEVTDGNRCKSSDTINVTVDILPSVNLGNDTLICDGNLVTLDAGTSGSGVLWSTSVITRTISVSNTSTIGVRVSSSATCYDEDTIIVTVQANPVVDLGTDAEICFGETYTLDAGNPGFTYDWSTNESTQTIDVSTSGNFSVVVTDAEGCEGTDDFNLTVHALPIIDVSLPADVCYDGGNVAILTNPTGGIISGTGVTGSQWNPKDGGLVADQGSYVYYDYADANNCSNKDSALVILRMNPAVTPLFSDTSICDYDDVELSASADMIANFVWLYNGSVIANTNTVTVENAGQYTVRANSDYNCTSEEHEVNVVVLNPEVEIASSSLRVKEGVAFEVFVVNPNFTYSYSWENQTTGATNTGGNWNTSVSEDAIISVVAKEQHCEATDQLDIEVLPTLKIPNVFTPNGDGVQDVWQIDGLKVYNMLSLKIYNRWGNLVFENNGVNDESWDGTYKGNPVPNGTYFYIIELYEGEGESFEGTLNVLR